MKMKLTTLSLTLLLFSLSSSACPIWLIGSVKIVDESGRYLQEAKIWKRYSVNDSQELTKGWFGSNKDQDSDQYFFYTGGYRIKSENELKFSSYYRISCPGYADLIVKEFNFKSNGRGINRTLHLPLIEVVMYRPQFIQKGDHYIELKQFEVDKIESNGDSSRTDLSQYLESFKNESEKTTLSRLAVSKFKTYPNPVTEYVKIDISDSMTHPYKVIIYDLQGKSIHETELTESTSKLDLQTLNAGTYYIRINNYKGEMKHCMRFVKL